MSTSNLPGVTITQTATLSTANTIVPQPQTTSSAPVETALVSSSIIINQPTLTSTQLVVVPVPPSNQPGATSIAASQPVMVGSVSLATVCIIIGSIIMVLVVSISCFLLITTRKRRRKLEALQIPVYKSEDLNPLANTTLSRPNKVCDYPSIGLYDSYETNQRQSVSNVNQPKESSFVSESVYYTGSMLSGEHELPSRYHRSESSDEHSTLSYNRNDQ